MKNIVYPILFVLAIGMLSHSAAAQGVYIGPQFGWAVQKPGISGIDFSGDRSYLYGLRAGVRVFFLAVELNYFRMSHTLLSDNPGDFEWEGLDIDTSYLGLNAKYYFPMLVLNPYLTAGYGYYSSDIFGVDNDRGKGFNLGLGLELQMGRKFSLLAEGKYHRVKIRLDEQDLTLGHWTLAGGFNIYFRP